MCFQDEDIATRIPCKSRAKGVSVYSDYTDMKGTSITKLGKTAIEDDISI